MSSLFILIVPHSFGKSHHYDFKHNSSDTPTTLARQHFNDCYALHKSTSPAQIPSWMLYTIQYLQYNTLCMCLSCPENT